MKRVASSEKEYELTDLKIQSKEYEFGEQGYQMQDKDEKMFWNLEDKLLSTKINDKLMNHSTNASNSWDQKNLNNNKLRYLI